MTIDYSRLLTMQQPEALEYLGELYSSGIGPITQTFGGTDVDAARYEAAKFGAVRPLWGSMYGGGEGDYAVPTGTYEARLTGDFDPEYAGGVYGGYTGTFDQDGNLLDVRFGKGERHNGWFSENLDWVGPLIVGGAMLGGSGLLIGAGSSGAGAGAGAGAGVGTAATEAGLAGLGELGINTALTGTELLANNAYAAALANGATAEVAANAAQIATNLAGSGLTEAAIIDSAVATAAETMATGAVGSTGSVIGGGGALTVTGGVAGAVPTGLEALWQGVKDVAAKAGIKDLKTAVQAGLVAAPLLEKALGSGNKGTVDAGYTNLVTPYTMQREVNPQAKPLTSQDAYAYLSNKPSPTTGQPVSTQQQNWFNDSFQRQESVNPVSGERFVTDPNTGRMYSSKELEELKKSTVPRAAGGGIAALAGGGFTSDIPSYENLQRGSALPNLGQPSEPEQLGLELSATNPSSQALFARIKKNTNLSDKDILSLYAEVLGLRNVPGVRSLQVPNFGVSYTRRFDSGGIAALAAGGGVGHLGGYSDGGQLLRGPGDGVSDSIPATIEGRQPARLADGEFVVPSRIVSELGNGSTEAGAKKLYAMMARIQRARRGTVGEGQIAKDTNAEKHLPA